MLQNGNGIFYNISVFKKLKIFFLKMLASFPCWGVGFFFLFLLLLWHENTCLNNVTVVTGLFTYSAVEDPNSLYQVLLEAGKHA